jgi:hypothetical protein
MAAMEISSPAHCSEMIRRRGLSLCIDPAAVSEDEDLQSFLFRSSAEDETHIRFASLCRAIFTPAPADEIMPQIVAVRLGVAQCTGDLESGLSQNLSIPVVIVGKGATQRDYVVLGETRI